MNLSLRLIPALFGGTVLAMIVTVAVEMAGHALLAPGLSAGPGLVPSPTVPLLLSVLLAHLLGSAVGAWSAVRLTPERTCWLGWVVGAILLYGSVTNLLRIPHPTWFAVVDVVGIAMASWWASNRASQGITGTPRTGGAK